MQTDPVTPQTDEKSNGTPYTASLLKAYSRLYFLLATKEFKLKDIRIINSNKIAINTM